MNAAEYRQLTPEERVNVLNDNRRKLLEMRCKQALGEDINSAELKGIKKDIARLLTVMQEAEAAGGKA